MSVVLVDNRSCYYMYMILLLLSFNIPFDITSLRNIIKQAFGEFYNAVSNEFHIWFILN